MLVKKTIVSAPTTEQVINEATAKMAADISSFCQQRESAFDVFRNTVKKLDNIDTGLNESISKLNALNDFIQEQKSTAEKTLADNAKVRAKILDIIGE